MAKGGARLDNLLKEKSAWFAAGGLGLLAGALLSNLILVKAAWWQGVAAALGAVLLGLFLWGNRSTVREVGGRRTTQVRLNLTLVMLAAFGIAVAVNVIAQRHVMRWDWTAEKRYSLSPQTKEILQKLQQPVTITFFYSSTQRTLPEVYRARLLLEEYQKQAREKIVYRAVDADQNPSEAERYKIREYNTVVFESQGNHKEVLQRDYVTYGLGAGRQPEPKFQGEKAFTSALLAMGEEKQKKIYFTEGHGERDLQSPRPDGLNIIQDVLKGENYQVEKINLLTEGKVPEDAEVVVVAGAQRPFQEREVDALLSWLKEGHALIWTVEPRVPNVLPRIAKTFGISFGNDIVIDRTRFAFPDIRAVIPQYRFHVITEKLLEGNVFTIFPYARSVQTQAADLDKVEDQILLETTAEGWGETNFTERQASYQEGQDTKGPAPMARVFEWTPEAAPEKKVRVVVFGSTVFLTNQMEGAPGNRDLFVNAVNFAARQESKITIRPKEEKRRFLTFTNVGANAVKYLVLFILPLGALGAGVSIWWRRRAQ